MFHFIAVLLGELSASLDPVVLGQLAEPTAFGFVVHRSMSVLASSHVVEFWNRFGQRLAGFSSVFVFDLGRYPLQRTAILLWYPAFRFPFR